MALPLEPVKFSFAVCCIALLLGGCNTTGGPAAGAGNENKVEYSFTEPEGSLDPPMDRIDAIKQALRQNDCQPGQTSDGCAKYALEAALIYALANGRESDIQDFLGRAYGFNQTCDLRMLQALFVAKRARTRGDLSAASAFFDGEGARCDRAVVRYYSAKLNMLAEDDDRIRAGRQKHRSISSSSIDDSGIPLEDRYDLRIYSYVYAAEFNEAKHQLRRAFEDEVEVSPRLHALALIGGGPRNAPAIRPEDRAAVREYLDQRLQDGEFGQGMADIATVVDRLGEVRLLDWEGIERRIDENPKLTPTQSRIMKLLLKDNFDSLQKVFPKLDEAKDQAAANITRLAVVEEELVAAAMAAALGDRGGNLQRARAAYLETVRQAAKPLKSVSGLLDGLAELEDLDEMLVEPQAYPRAVEAVSEIVARLDATRKIDADAKALGSFVKSAIQTLPPGEFFEAWELNLDQLGGESKQVVQNVRRIMDQPPAAIL